MTLQFLRWFYHYESLGYDSSILTNMAELKAAQMGAI